MVAKASYFKDNTDYSSAGAILDNIGSNKSIKEPLTIKDFTLQGARLSVVISMSQTSEAIFDIIQQYPNDLELSGDELRINTTLEKKHLQNNGISFDKPGKFDEKQQPIERSHGLQITRQNTPTKNTQRHNNEDTL